MSWLRVAVAVVVILGLSQAGQGQTPAVLTVADVLSSVDRAFPLLDAARQEQEAAAGEALIARGAFDLNLSASADALRGNVYDNETAAIGLIQPLSVAGASVFGGYRVGRGTFASYDGKAQTLSDGEWRAGVALPLLRNRAIDGRRANLTRTAIGQQLAEARVAAARLRFIGEAAGRYWDWVAAGRQEAVAARLLSIADARDRDLAEAIALGQIAPVERLDNRRAILQRQSGVVAARRQLERQAIGLSLYYRRDDGSQRRPDPRALPPAMPQPPQPLTREGIEADIAAASVDRPDVRALSLVRRQQEVAADLARNDLLPALDLFSQVSRDAGGGPGSFAGTEVDAGVAFNMPAQRRQGRGALQAALAALSRIDAELRFARDRVRAEVEDAASALDAALQTLSLVQDELDVARQLEQAERDRFDLGESTQFLVNLRELATADAAFREISATAEAHRARVAYDVATGALTARPTMRTP